MTPEFFGIDEPAFYSDNDKFNIRHKGAGLKVHYHFTENTKGFYIGANSGYGMTYATEKKSGEKQQGAAVEAGIHTGYRVFLFKNNQGKGFYINPWVSLSYQIYQEKISFKTENFDQKNWTVFPTVHFGYRF